MGNGIRKFILLGIGLSLVLPMPSVHASPAVGIAAIMAAINNPRTPMNYNADPANRQMANFSPAPDLPQLAPGERSLASAQSLQDLQTFVDANRKNLAEATDARAKAKAARETLTAEQTELKALWAREKEEMHPEKQARLKQLDELLKSGGEQELAEKELERREGVFKDNIVKGTGMQAEAQRSLQATGGSGGGGSGGGGSGGGKGGGGGGALALIAGAAVIGGAIAAVASMNKDDKKNDGAIAAQVAADEAARKQREAEFNAKQSSIMQSQLIQKDQMKRAADDQILQQLLMAQVQAEKQAPKADKYQDIKLPTPTMNQPTGGTTVVAQGDAMVAKGAPDLLSLTGRPASGGGQPSAPGTGSPISTPPLRLTASRQVAAADSEGVSDECSVRPAEKVCYDRRNESVSCRSRRAVRFVKAPQRAAAAGRPGSCQPSGPLTSLHR